MNHKSQFNLLLIIFLFIALLFRSFLSFSQVTTQEAEKDGYKMNAIKGMPYVVGNFFNGGYAGISAGYERQIGKHHVVEMTGYMYYHLVDEMGGSKDAFCIMPGYKYVVTSNSKIFNNTWCSAYLVYFERTNHPNGDGDSISYPSLEYLNGVGCSIGRKIYFSKKETWFLELGIGASFNVFNFEPKFTYSTDPIPVILRPIIQIGGKF